MYYPDGFCFSYLTNLVLHNVCFCTLIGLKIMATYETELDRVEASRQELAKAEKLFNLPITMYPELLNVQKEMKGLRQIYEIYKSQKVRMTINYINFDLCSEQL